MPLGEPDGNRSAGGRGWLAANLRKSLPIRVYLTCFVFALVFPLVTLAGMVGYQYVHAEQEHLDQQARLAARQVQGSLLREIELATLSLQTLATCDCLRTGNLDLFWHQADVISSHTGNYITIEPQNLPIAGSGRTVSISARDTGMDIVVHLPVEIAGQPGYRLVSTISEPALTSLLERFSRTRGWPAILIDMRDRVVAATEGQPSSIPALSQTEKQQLWTQTEGVWTGLTATGVSLAAFATLQSPRVAVVVAVPDAVIAQLIAHAASLLAAFSAVALLLALCSAYMLGNRLDHTIRDLAVAAEKVRRGEKIEPLQTEIEEINQIALALTTAVNVQIASLGERNAAYSLLEMEEARMRSVLEAAPVALVISDAQGVIQSFSVAAERLFGIPRAEIADRRLPEILPDDDFTERAAGMPPGSHSFGGVAPRLGTVRNRRGERFPVEIASGIVRLHDRTLVTSFIRDLREEQRLHDELHHAQRMEALGQLTGGIAHDFNNLLTVITGNLEMASRARSHARSAPLLREARAAAEMGAALVHQLLSFGRRQRLTPERFDVGGMVLELCQLLRRSLGERIHLDATGAETGHGARLDIAQLQSAIINIAINARDAMPAGGTLRIVVTKRTFHADAPKGSKLADGTYVVIAMTDTGTGMSALTRARAFEPFFSTKPSASGTGLGLSMVYGFAIQSGGYATIDSRPRKGTTVTLYLPHHPLGKEPAREPTRETRDAKVASAHTILVVEDHDQVRRITCRRLAELGYSVRSARDANAALRQLEDEPAIDLLLTDIALPGEMSGDELARHVRKQAPHPAIVLMSGYTHPSRLRLEQSGWLGKPHTAEELERVIRVALAGMQRVTRPAARPEPQEHSLPTAPT